MIKSARYAFYLKYLLVEKGRCPMKKDLNRILIETTVRKTIKQIQDDPERSTRNLIDMALNFSEGRFQHHFLKTAQDMLKNEHSCYYQIIPDAVSTIDTERMITFGINVGYNSCTKGAATIRSIEEKENFNIPWSISLEINGTDYYNKDQMYISLIEQGQKLGIYTWIIYVHDAIVPILELVEKFPQCAFIIFCSPSEITDALLDESNELYNLMYVIEFSNGVEDACSLLRSRNFLYSIYYPYQECDVDKIINGDILSDTEILHPVFTIFYAYPPCPQNIRTQVYQYVQYTRTEQKYKTIPFDMIYDNHFIDGIISDQACSIGFTQDGKCYSVLGQSVEERYNCFDRLLKEILQQVSPKKSL